MDIRPPDVVLQEFTQHLSVLEEKEKREQLEAYLNYLILNDFNALVNLLYRADVNESKLKGIIANEKEKDAAVVIAGLLIDRMKEKADTRRKFTPGEQIPEDEKW